MPDIESSKDKRLNKIQEVLRDREHRAAVKQLVTKFDHISNDALYALLESKFNGMITSEDREKALTNNAMENYKSFLLSLNDTELKSLGGQNNTAIKMSLKNSKNSNNAAVVFRRLAAGVYNGQDGIRGTTEAFNKLKETGANKHVVKRYELKLLNFDAGNDIENYLEITQFLKNGTLEGNITNKLPRPGTSSEYVIKTDYPAEFWENRQKNTLHYLDNLLEMLGDFNKSNVVPSDLKPGNIGIDDNNNLKFTDTKSFVYVPPEMRERMPVRKFEHSAPYLPPEEFNNQGSTINVDKVQAYMAGLTMMEYLIDYQISVMRKPDGTHPLEEQFENHPAFKGEEGKVLRSVLAGLTNPDPDKRWTIEQAKTHMNTYQTMMDNIKKTESNSKTFHLKDTQLGQDILHRDIQDQSPTLGQTAKRMSTAFRSEFVKKREINEAKPKSLSDQEDVESNQNEIVSKSRESTRWVSFINPATYTYAISSALYEGVKSFADRWDSSTSENSSFLARAIKAVLLPPLKLGMLITKPLSQPTETSKQIKANIRHSTEGRKSVDKTSSKMIKKLGNPPYYEEQRASLEEHKQAAEQAKQAKQDALHQSTHHDTPAENGQKHESAVEEKSENDSHHPQKH